MERRRRMIRPERMKKKPKGSYRILGAIGDGVQEQIGTYEDGTAYYEAPKSRWLYKISGYMRISHDEYLEVYISRKGRVFILTATLILLLIMSGVGLWALFNNKGNLLDPDAEDYTPKIQVPKNTDASKIAIPGYSDIRIPEGSTAHISLWNPEGNPCYFKFIITLDETKEQLYESGLVEPGKAVTEQKLSRKLKEGSYAITIKIKSYSLNDAEKEMNGGQVQTDLIVVKADSSN